VTEPNDRNQRQGQEQGWAEVVWQVEADGDCQTQESLLEVSKKSFLHRVWYCPLFKGAISWNEAKRKKRNLGKKTRYKDLYLEPRSNNRHHED